MLQTLLYDTVTILEHPNGKSGIFFLIYFILECLETKSDK